jgi:hypothetical protein
LRTRTPPVCPKCGGTDLKKAVSRFARVRSEDDALEALADRADNADLDDPATMRRFMKEMAGEMGEDMDGEDIEQMMEEAMDEEAGGGRTRRRRWRRFIGNFVGGARVHAARLMPPVRPFPAGGPRMAWVY